MRKVVEEPDLAARKAAVGIADITRTHGLAVATAFVERRFKTLEAMSLERPGPATTPPHRPRLTLPHRLISGASRRLVRKLEQFDGRR
jgi:hypothetical protein